MNDLDYIKFLLIGDEFDVSRLLREKASHYGMDTIYSNDCDYIARAFNLYDALSGNYKTMSMYDSLVKFLTTYNSVLQEIIDEIEIELFEFIRSDFNEQN